ncbi:MAG: HyaD/HybD family hydrogenase maturation endopeptidase [Gemmatimonadota bacterium]|nr:HyaD/HybD family hydrogenase maturation endopeptidase [Gemmatimonadota bacterium]
MTEAAPTLVVGLGNPLMADDGIGIAALERLRERWAAPAGVELVDGGTWGLFLLPRIEDASRVILIDAIDAGEEPGTVVVLEGDEIHPALRGGALSPHQIGVRDLVGLATFRGTLPEETVAIGIQPNDVGLSTGLSPAAEAALDTLLERVLDRLEAWGFPREIPAETTPCTR